MVSKSSTNTTLAGNCALFTEDMWDRHRVITDKKSTCLRESYSSHILAKSYCKAAGYILLYVIAWEGDSP
jgi:hypothetical protein